MTHGFEARIGVELSYRNFILDRFARIYPLHALFLLVFLGYECVKLIAFYNGVVLTKPAFVENNATTFVTNALMIHAMGLHDGYSFNVPSWTVSVEFVTYCLFGFALIVVHGRGARIFLALGAILLSSFFLLTVPQKFMHATYDYGLFRGIYGFFLGYLAYHLSIAIAGRGFNPPYMGALELGALLAICWFIVSVGEDNPFAVLSSVLFAASMIIFSFDGGLISRLLACRPVQLLGAWSYPIYLGHFLVISLIGIVIRHGMGLTDVTALAPGTGDFFIVVYLMVTISLAATLHNKYEMPAKHWSYPKLRNLVDDLARRIQSCRVLISCIAVRTMAAVLLLVVLAGSQHLRRHDKPLHEVDKIAMGAVFEPWKQTYRERPPPLAQRKHVSVEGSSSSRF